MLVLRYVSRDAVHFGLRLTPRRPDGNFLIDYHPSCDNLFIATGGSGHAFKFFPVIGEKVLAAIERRLDPELKNLWSWRAQAAENFIGTDDGSQNLLSNDGKELE